MLLFLDTEFTDLIPGNKLISIALVDEHEDFFYAELTDTYELADCSDFVKSFILPFLRGGEYKMPYNECALKIVDWIENRNCECIIASDAPGWDMPHLNRLLKSLWPDNLQKNMVFPVCISEIDEECIRLENIYDIHNALHDALTMKKVVMFDK
jgi:hypothetical protein